MAKHRSDLHIEVMGNGVRIIFTRAIYRKMLRAPFANDAIRENQSTWLLAPIVDRDPGGVADEIATWALHEGIEISP